MTQDTLPAFSRAAASLTKDGLYQHYSGRRYKILGVARHSESLEELVVYQALYGDQDIWVRPLEMFLENVTIQGLLQPRFTLIN